MKNTHHSSGRPDHLGEPLSDPAAAPGNNLGHHAAPGNRISLPAPPKSPILTLPPGVDFSRRGGCFNRRSHTPKLRSKKARVAGQTWQLTELTWVFSEPGRLSTSPAG